MEFVYGVEMLESSLINLKTELLKKPEGTTLKMLFENYRTGMIMDPMRLLSDYEDSFDYRILPRKYEDKYDYEFLCRMEKALKEYEKRMYSKIDENYHLAVKPIEEIIARAIFIFGGDDLKDFLDCEGFEWEEKDYESHFGGARFVYDEDWIYDAYFSDGDIEYVLYEDNEVSKEAEEMLGIYLYPYEELFDKVFWGTDIHPISDDKKESV